ncbi:MAG: hypothetical protein AAGM22_22685 [Acidobacteriota bacterium]
MDWIGILELVDRVHRRYGDSWLNSAPKSGQDFRTAAGIGSMALGNPLATPEFVNFAALAIRAGTAPRATRISPALAQLAVGLDRDLEAPEPTWPQIVVGPRPDKTLLGDVSQIAAYELDGEIYVIGLQYPDGCKVSSVPGKAFALFVEGGADALPALHETTRRALELVRGVAALSALPETTIDSRREGRWMIDYVSAGK